MNKEQFLERLEWLLADIPEEERTEALAFYRSYFEDAGEGNEAEIMKELESPEKVAEIIKKDLGTAAFYQGETQKTAEDTEKGRKRAKTEKMILWIVAAVVTCPLWLTVLAVFAALLVAAAGIVIGCAAAVAAVMVSCIAAGFILSGVGIGYMVTDSFAVGLGLLGGGFLVLAIGALAVWAAVWCFGWFIPWFVKEIVKLCKNEVEKRRRKKAV